jgi:hypothetical protein
LPIRESAKLPELKADVFSVAGTPLAIKVASKIVAPSDPVSGNYG